MAKCPVCSKGVITFVKMGGSRCDNGRCSTNLVNPKKRVLDVCVPKVEYEKIIDVIGINIVGENKRMGKSGLGKKQFTTKEYKDFKEQLKAHCKIIKLRKPFWVKMWLRMNHDIDAPIKPILDVISEVCEMNDKFCEKLEVVKKQKERNGTSGIVVYVGEI